MMGSTLVEVSAGLVVILLSVAAATTIFLLWRVSGQTSVKVGQTAIVVSTLLALIAFAGYVAQGDLNEAFDDWVITNAFAAASISSASADVGLSRSHGEQIFAIIDPAHLSNPLPLLVSFFFSA